MVYALRLRYDGAEGGLTLDPGEEFRGAALAVFVSVVAIMLCLISLIVSPGSSWYAYFFYLPVLVTAFYSGWRACLIAGLLDVADLAATVSYGNGLVFFAIGRSALLMAVAIIAGTFLPRWFRRGSRSGVSSGKRIIHPVTPAAAGMRACLLKPGDARKLERDVLTLIAATRNRDPIIVYEACGTLGKTHDPRAVESLIAVLAGEGAGGVRWKAAEALGRMGPAAVQPLAGLLSGHPDPDVRWKAAYALGEIGDAQATDALVTALSDEDRFVRTRAAHALSRLGDGIFPALEKALSSHDPQMRQGSAEAISRLTDPRSVLLLLKAMGDPSDEVRSSAACAFSTIPDSISALSQLLSEGPGHEGAEQVLISIGTQSGAEAVLHALEGVPEAEKTLFEEALRRCGHAGTEGLRDIAGSVCRIFVTGKRNGNSH